MGIAPQFETVTEAVPFDALYLHPLNPRGEATEAEIATLAENIRELGLIQNLAGLRDAETGRVGIVAGGRRLRALALLRDDPRFQSVPVKIASSEDEAATWAAAENHARAALHPADEIREYTPLRDRGTTEAAIAIAFGVTREHVKRRLRLAALPEPVLTALRADKIDLTAAAAFVVSNDAARMAEVLAELIAGQGRYGADQIRRMLKTGTVRDTDRRARFVGVPAYRAAGGGISSDLLGGEVYLDDPDILDAVFTAKLEEAAEKFRADEGWKWARPDAASSYEWNVISGFDCEVLYPVEGALTETEAERHDGLARRRNFGEQLSDADRAELARIVAIAEGGYTPEQRAVSGVMLYVNHHGDLEVTRAVVLPEDYQEAADAGIIEARHVTPEDEGDGSDSPLPAPTISEALRQDLRAVRRGARQHAALEQHDLLLSMLAFHLSGAFGNRGFSISRHAVATTPTTGAEGYTADPRLLGADAGRSSASDLARAFKAFRKKGADHVRDVLTLELARLLDLPHADEGFAKLYDKEAATDVRAVWRPTVVNFFSRVKGDYLDSLWTEMVGIDADSGEARAFAKAKKAEKAARLETMFDPATELPEAQRARVAAWLPPEMF